MVAHLYHQARFLTSAATVAQCPPDSGREVAFAGRSNAGKSTVLNVLTGQRQLARTSKTPGRTQLINFFSLDDQRRLVDLPGYGYAQVPQAMKDQWQATLSRYLETRHSLVGLVLLMDSRHPLQALDLLLLDWAIASKLPTHILLNKSDKLNRQEANRAVRLVESEIASYPFMSVQAFSALKKTGLDDFIRQLNLWLS